MRASVGAGSATAAAEARGRLLHRQQAATRAAVHPPNPTVSATFTSKRCCRSVAASRRSRHCCAKSQSEPAPLAHVAGAAIGDSTTTAAGEPESHPVSKLPASAPSATRVMIGELRPMRTRYTAGAVADS